MRVLPESLIEDIKKAVSEVGYGSVEIVLSGPDEKIDVITHERNRYFLPKPDKFHQG